MTPGVWDWALALLLTVGLQALILAMDRGKQPVAERAEAAQLSYYNQTLLIFLVALVLILGGWVVMGRPLAALGLEMGAGWPAIAGWAFALSATVVMIVNVIGVSRNETWREKARQDIDATEGMDDVLPRTAREYHRFMLLSLMGGATEEVIYRGFLIWVLAAHMPVWLAGAVSLSFFVIAHTYYGSWSGRLKVLLAGALLTALYLLSGSLWPAILLHVAMDMASGTVAWRVRRPA